MLDFFINSIKINIILLEGEIEDMCTLAYKLDDNDIILETGTLKRLDEITTKYLSNNNIIKAYDDVIGRYMYDFDYDTDDFSKIIKGENLKLTYTLNGIDKEIIEETTYTDLSKINAIELSLLLRNDKELLNPSILCEDILVYKSILRDYLKKIEDHPLYYDYLRIIHTYYLNKDKEKTFSKKLTIFR